jgi:hypothetical protein
LSHEKKIKKKYLFFFFFFFFFKISNNLGEFIYGGEHAANDRISNDVILTEIFLFNIYNIFFIIMQGIKNYYNALSFTVFFISKFETK